MLRDTALRSFGANHPRNSLLVSAAVPPISQKGTDHLVLVAPASSPHRRLVAGITKLEALLSLF